MSGQIGTSAKKPQRRRGKAKASLALITAMVRIVEAAQPITGRGVGYKLFVLKLIASMGTNDMHRVYRLLKEAREQGTISWDAIVDESRSLEKVSTWSDPDAYVGAVINSYRREYWNQQPQRIAVWSEKGTVRGVLRPVLDEYGVGFRVVHGFASATVVHDEAEYNDGRRLVVLYVGDWDPSGLCMSEVDLPARLTRYEGHHVVLKRIALTQSQTRGLPSFPASDKRKDPRYGWFVRTHGQRCWELDAFDPNELRDCVRKAIKAEILDKEAWQRCKVIERAERGSLRHVMHNWKPGKPQGWGLL
jgi:hypothetical protein